ncbi:sigma-70 family RNA polymerase sigma factor [Pedococcus aerophilus]|uniref:RNA polymerase sigma factor n=1 Tax=Pedococcus aerophilus TaxID=436356 RepID=A0ABN3UMU9_9MICO
MSDGGRATVAPSDRTGDAALARAAALGDREAFEVIVHRYGPALYRYAARTTGDAGDAQDVVQEAFVAAWKALDRFDARSSLKTWLFSIVSHKVADRNRRSRALPIDDALMEAIPTGGGDPFAEATHQELVDALDHALRELPYRQRACWILVEIEGMSQAEVAEAQGMTPDAVRGHLFRARRNLSERMARWKR